ncbi:MAG: hypothetical protein AAF149_02865 [Bacteroidota bacterium]
MEAAFEIGTPKGSNWSITGLTVAGIILNLVIIVGLTMDQPFYEGQLKEVKGNELYYDASIPKEDIDKLVQKLGERDFFGQDYGNIARLRQIGDA